MSLYTPSSHPSSMDASALSADDAAYLHLQQVHIQQLHHQQAQLAADSSASQSHSSRSLLVGSPSSGSLAGSASARSSHAHLPRLHKSSAASLPRPANLSYSERAQQTNLSIHHAHLRAIASTASTASLHCGGASTASFRTERPSTLPSASLLKHNKIINRARILREQEIHRANLAMVAKITSSVLHGRSPYSAPPATSQPFVHKTLNLHTRRKEQERIMKENLVLAKRIIDKPSNLRASQWSSHAKQHAQLVAKISKYPYHHDIEAATNSNALQAASVASAYLQASPPIQHSVASGVASSRGSHVSSSAVLPLAPLSQPASMASLHSRTSSQHSIATAKQSHAAERRRSNRRSMDKGFVGANPILLKPLLHSSPNSVCSSSLANGGAPSSSTHSSHAAHTSQTSSSSLSSSPSSSDITISIPIPTIADSVSPPASHSHTPVKSNDSFTIQTNAEPVFTIRRAQQSSNAGVPVVLKHASSSLCLTVLSSSSVSSSSVASTPSPASVMVGVDILPEPNTNGVFATALDQFEWWMEEIALNNNNTQHAGDTASDNKQFKLKSRNNFYITVNTPSNGAPPSLSLTRSQFVDSNAPFAFTLESISSGYRVRHVSTGLYLLVNSPSIAVPTYTIGIGHTNIEAEAIWNISYCYQQQLPTI